MSSCGQRGRLKHGKEAGGQTSSVDRFTGSQAYRPNMSTAERSACIDVLAMQPYAPFDPFEWSVVSKRRGDSG